MEWKIHWTYVFNILSYEALCPRGSYFEIQDFLCWIGQVLIKKNVRWYFPDVLWVFLAIFLGVIVSGPGTPWRGMF